MSNLSERKMAMAGAIEDYATEYLHGFITLLIDQEYMTERDALQALGKFDESLQDPDPK